MAHNSKQINQFNAKQMAAHEAAYAAGFIDGEGTISIWGCGKGATRSTLYRPVVEASNTNLTVLTHMLDITGNGRISLHNTKSEKHKERYKWQLTPSQVRFVLPQIFPYLVGKKDQANIVLNFCYIQDYGKAKGFRGIADEHLKLACDLVNQIIELNKRGALGEGRKKISQHIVNIANPRYCTVEGCEQRAYKENELCYAHWKKTRPPKITLCGMCGKPIEVYRGDRKFCGSKCMNAFYYAQKQQLKE